MPVNAPALEADGLIDGQNLSRWAAGVEIRLKQIIAQPDKSMGFLEEEVLQQTLALQRENLERATQARADRVPLDCPCCKRPLEKIRPDQKRQIDSRCGEIALRRAYGWCVRCEEWFYPAWRRMHRLPRFCRRPWPYWF